MTVVRTWALVVEPLLFAAVGSKVPAVPLTTLLNVALLAGAVTVTVKLVVAALAKLVSVQFTTPLLLVPPPEALTNVTPAGSVSLTTTLVAVLGPRLVAVIV